ncbi:MAG: restriction endonuclease [Tissierellia bacterium]|nr:restriction endonuclease [Tissierellia bacterium]
MIFLETYRRLGLVDENNIFEYLISTLKDSNQTFDYFVDWGTVFNNVGEIEKQLNILNYLIGKENIKDEFGLLIKEYPEIVNVIPVLLAIRAKSLKVLIDYKQKDWVYKEYFFRKKSKYSDEEIDDIIEFCQLSGFLKLFKKKKIKNLVDYCIGMEVGIGTNGRKNRSGDIMEGIMDWHVKNTCDKLNLQYIKHGNKMDTMKNWGINLPIDEANRIHDFIINRDGKLVIIETNFYSASGSKLKATVGEYQELYKFLKDKEEIDSFIWITDGIGWETTQSSLKEAFGILDYLFNIKLVSEGALEEVLK